MARRFSLVTLAATLAVTGCVSQAQFLYNMQPAAVQNAEARGRFELNCPSATATVLSREVVQPAYLELLRFMRSEYLPGTRTTLAAEALPDGKSYYRAKIREFTTLDMDPEAIHELGVREVARLHEAMLEQMHATGFSGEFPQFLRFLRTDPRFYAKTPQELLMRAAWIAKVFDGKAATCRARALP